MNLYLRLFILLIRCCFVKRKKVLDSSVLYLHAMPWDCDLNIHVTNSRYLAFMDLGRIFLMAHIPGLLKNIFKDRWAPIVSSAEIQFIRAIPPFAKIKMVTRLICWDEKYLYIEQNIYHRGQICTKATLRGALYHRGKPIPMQKILDLSGESTLPSPEMPPHIQQWKKLLEMKKSLG